MKTKTIFRLCTRTGKTARVVAVAFIAGLVLSAPAFADTVKFGHIAPQFHGLNAGAKIFADHVREKTGGKIDIQVFPMGQLGSERSMAEQVQSGTLQIASLTTAVLQNFEPRCAVLDMPFIFPNRATAYATLDDPAVRKKIFSAFPKKGFIAIGWMENDIRDFSNTKRPIRTPEDIKGLKIRVMNSPAYLDTFEQLGATAVGIPFPEMYNALQTGVIDAQENPLITAILTKVTEVTKYVTMTQHCMTACVTVIGVDYWESLSKKEQEIFREAAELAMVENRVVNARMKESLPKIGISIADYAKQENIEIIELTSEERNRFRDAMVPVWNKYREKLGNEIFDFMLERIEANHR